MTPILAYYHDMFHLIALDHETWYLQIEFSNSR